jgi:hypothetical protein
VQACRYRPTYNPFFSFLDHAQSLFSLTPPPHTPPLPPPSACPHRRHLLAAHPAATSRIAWPPLLGLQAAAAGHRAFELLLGITPGLPPDHRLVPRTAIGPLSPCLASHLSAVHRSLTTGRRLRTPRTLPRSFIMLQFE